MNGVFEMVVHDIFRIGKHTIFIGIVQGEDVADRIIKCRCNLLCGNEVLLSEITIEDEDIFTKTERSLRTIEDVNIDRSVLKRGECRLVCLPS